MKSIKLISYNIDGLPESLDLNDLPWILKPIAWIYKLIKKDTKIRINDNEDTEHRITDISQFIKTTNADIIAVQEDFNYHSELMQNLSQNYNDSEHRGGFDIHKLFSSIDWFSDFPLPRFKADGLNLITKKSRVVLQEEDCVKWNDCFGYIDHANDKLTHKGFCMYTILVDNEYEIDVYNIHMDADYRSDLDGEKDLEVRKSQINQLCNYIIDRYNNGNTNPVIIIGDTNSYPDRWEDVNNINNTLLSTINSVEELNIQESVPNNVLDVDRVFYINNSNSLYSLQPAHCEYNLDVWASDHNPLIVEFNIILKHNEQA